MSVARKKLFKAALQSKGSLPAAWTWHPASCKQQQDWLSMLVWDSKGIFGSLAEKTQVASPSVTRPGWSNHGRYHTPPAPCCRPIRSRCPGGLRCPQEIGLRNLRSKAKRNKCIIILILILILILIIIIIIIIIWLSERLPECTFQIHGISLSLQ